VARIGVINISDGRDYVHDGIADFITANEDKLVAGLEAAGHEVVRAKAPVSSNARSRRPGSTSPCCTTACGRSPTSPCSPRAS
jgi:hypothetical protein